MRSAHLSAELILAPINNPGLGHRYILFRNIRGAMNKSDLMEALSKDTGLSVTNQLARLVYIGNNS